MSLECNDNSEISAAIERANECINKLEMGIADFYPNSPGMDVNANFREKHEAPCGGEVPVEIHNLVSGVIEALLNILTPPRQPLIDAIVSSSPPEWWRKAYEALRPQGLESRSTDRIFDIMSIFKPYVSENLSYEIIPFIIVAADDRNWKLRVDGFHSGVRSFNKPYADNIAVILELKTDKEINDAFEEASPQIVPFSEACDMFFRSAFDEIQMLVE